MAAKCHTPNLSASGLPEQVQKTSNLVLKLGFNGPLIVIEVSNVMG